MSANLTFLDTSNTFADIVEGINYSTSGLPAYMLLLMTFIISFVAFKNYDTSADFVASSFITLITGALMYFLGWIGVEITYIPLIMLIISLLMLASKN